MSRLDDEVLGELQADFTYKNPQKGFLRRIGKPVWNLPDNYETWKINGDYITFPRGGMAKVRSILDDKEIEYVFRDRRTEGAPCVDFPKYIGPDLRYYQEEGIQAALKKENCVIRAPTGCLSGDTLVGLNRGGISRAFTIRDLVARRTGNKVTGVPKPWNLSIQTRIRMRASDGFIRLGTVVDAWESGEKETFRVVTRGGKEIRATLDHRFLVFRNGESRWLPLRRIRIGDRVHVDIGVSNSPKRREKNWYQLVSGVKSHPYVGRRGVEPGKGGWSVPKHRLVVEAVLNKLSYDEFVRRLKNGEVEGLHFLDPKEFHVHHIDEDPRNNSLSNLEVKTSLDHHTEHGRQGGWKHVTARTGLDEVVSIGEPRVEMTYDIEVMEEDHNFIANGFVVHNSGKSLLAIALASRIKLNTLVILPTVALFKQWVKDASEALDVGKLGVGIIHGQKRVLRPITAAVQKSLANALSNKEFFESLIDFFGVVIVDEAQKCAASSYQQVVDPWPARYRIGVSADERRQDRKDFLTHDLLGNKVYEIKRDQLEDEGHVLDVEIRVVPTDFEAPWYGLPEEESSDLEEEVVEGNEKDLDFKRLVDEMNEDTSRTQLGIDLVLAEVEQGHQVIVLTHRREHCYAIDHDIVVRGVPTGFFIGGVDHAREFEATKVGIANNQIKVGIGTYSALGVGVNLPTVSIGIAMTPIAGNRYNFNQVRGRLCRLSDGKTQGILYVLWDKNVYPEHLRNMVSWNPNVKVFIKGEWLDARKYLGMKPRRARQRRLAS